jgi:hypothetical protein
MKGTVANIKRRSFTADILVTQFGTDWAAVVYQQMITGHSQSAELDPPAVYTEKCFCKFKVTKNEHY